MSDDPQGFLKARGCVDFAPRKRWAIEIDIDAHDAADFREIWHMVLNRVENGINNSAINGDESGEISRFDTHGWSAEWEQQNSYSRDDWRAEREAWLARRREAAS